MQPSKVTRIALSFWINYGMLRDRDIFSEVIWRSVSPGILLVSTMFFGKESPRWLS
jgi:hypothetical protein